MRENFWLLVHKNNNKKSFSINRLVHKNNNKKSFSINRSPESIVNTYTCLSKKGQKLRRSKQIKYDYINGKIDKIVKALLLA